MAQHQNWLWGWQLQIFLNVFAVVAGFVLLCKLPFRWKNFFLSLFLGIIASFSFGTGILYWFIGLLILFLIHPSKKSSNVIAIALLVLVGIVVITSYFHNYQKPQHHPSLTTIFEHPTGYAKYVLVFLGNAVNNQHSLLLGFSGITVMLVSIVLLTRLQQVKLEILIPYVAMGLYSIGCAFAIGVGRLGLGFEQAKESRYVTISNLIWISNVILLYLLIRTSFHNLKKAYKGHELHGKPCLIGQKYLLILSIVVVAIIILNAAWNSKSGIIGFEARYNFLTPARLELWSLKNDELLGRLYPIPDEVKSLVPILKRHKLSIFRNDSSEGIVRPLFFQDVVDDSDFHSR